MNSPIVFFRVILPIGPTADWIGYVMGLFYLLLSVILLLKSMGNNGFAYFVGGFAILSALRFILAGTTHQQIFVYLLPFTVGIAVASLGNSKQFMRYLLRAYGAGLILNALTVFDPTGYIKSGIETHTQQGNPYFASIGDYGYRLAGFLIAPGIMALFAIFGLAVGIVMFAESRKKLGWLLLIVASFFCGIMTANRSFVIGLAVIFCFYAFVSLRSLLGLFRTLLMILIVLAAFGYVWQFTNYGKRMEFRFSQERFEKDLKTRTLGDASSIKALHSLKINPFFGSLYIHPSSGTVLVWNGDEVIRPHNGISRILSTRGLVLGVPFLVLLGISLWRLFKVGFVLKDIDPERRALGKAFFVAMIAGNAVCFSDSLLESTPMLMGLAYGLICLNPYKREGKDSPDLTKPIKTTTPHVDFAQKKYPDCCTYFS